MAAIPIATTLVGLVAVACWTNFVDPKLVDFLSYWAAGHMAMEGRGAAAYDLVAHRFVERTVIPVHGLMPFPYPPPFLLIVAPFGLLSYRAAFAAWILATGLLYVAAASRHVRPAIALAHPCVLSNGLLGQNGFLTSAIFLFGTKWLEQKPILAGVILGLMVIKPQLALLLPIALIAGRHWSTIAAAAASSLVLLGTALLVFGMGAYEGFLRILPVYANFIDASLWPWDDFASAFAFARYLGVPAGAAMAVHAVIAVAAAATVWRSWRKRWHDRVPILAAATVLIPPYLFSYDALLLVLPLASLLAHKQRSWIVPIVWTLSALPLAGSFGLVVAPNGLPLAAITMLVILCVEAVRRPPSSPAG